MRLYPIALITGLLPLITIHLCYLWSASNGHVPWCFPYIDSCTSISATGRKMPEFFLFKALMIPSAVFIATYWFLSCEWLLSLGCNARRQRMALMALGVIASAGLILYSVMLGAIGEMYALQRRIGVTTFFGLSYLAQLLINWMLGKTPVIREHFAGQLKVMTRISLIILITGVISLSISALDQELYHATDDAFEWTFTLMLCCHVLYSARLWRLTGFRAGFSAQRA